MAENSKVSPDTLSCSICGKTFKTSQGKKGHETKMHKGLITSEKSQSVDMLRQILDHLVDLKQAVGELKRDGAKTLSLLNEEQISGRQILRPQSVGSSGSSSGRPSLSSNESIVESPICCVSERGDGESPRVSQGVEIDETPLSQQGKKRG